MYFVDLGFDKKPDMFRLYWYIAIFVFFVIYTQVYRIAVKKDGIYTYLEILGLELPIKNKLNFKSVSIKLSERDVIFTEFGIYSNEKNLKTLRACILKFQFSNFLMEARKNMKASFSNNLFRPKNKPILLQKSDFKKFLQAVFDRIGSGEIDGESSKIAGRLGLYLKNDIRII